MAPAGIIARGGKLRSVFYERWQVQRVVYDPVEFPFQDERLREIHPTLFPKITGIAAPGLLRRRGRNFGANSKSAETVAPEIVGQNPTGGKITRNTNAHCT